MGDDLRVVNAARVSFDKESEWDKGEAYEDYDWYEHEYVIRHKNVLSDKDKKLINYLAKHNHWTPFSHVLLTMRETVPIFVARQRFKHMVGFTYNEVSRRYVDSEPTFFVPDVWRGTAENKKQGSSDEIVEPVSVSKDGKTFFTYEDIIDLAALWYAENNHIASEQARMVLPQSMYTSYYVTGSLAAWARAYRLRIDPHAQKEIQDLAKQWGDIISQIPELKFSWEALTK